MHPGVNSWHFLDPFYRDCKHLLFRYVHVCTGSDQKYLNQQSQKIFYTIEKILMAD